MIDGIPKNFAPRAPPPTQRAPPNRLGEPAARAERRADASPEAHDQRVCDTIVRWLRGHTRYFGDIACVPDLLGVVRRATWRPAPHPTPQSVDPGGIHAIDRRTRHIRTHERTERIRERATPQTSELSQSRMRLVQNGRVLGPNSERRVLRVPERTYSCTPAQYLNVQLYRRLT